jgi:hypothetical protein
MRWIVLSPRSNFLNPADAKKRAADFVVSPFSMDIQNYQQTNKAVQNRNEYHTN